uniref:Putative bel-16 dwil-i n=1 Tax=Nyssomyia neivai TaxID=330878 RepID=A0A1L8DIN7_9DIPT
MEFHSFNSLCLTVSKTVRAVRAINVHRFDAWPINDVLQHLDDATKLKWVSECKGKVPTWDDFEKFLFTKLKDMESVGITTADAPKQDKFNTKFSKAKATALVAANSTPCRCCEQDSHPLFKCPKFLAQSPNDRFQTVKELKLCRKCITSNHMTSSCNFRTCAKCNLHHNVLLHDSFADHASSQAHAEPLATASTLSAVVQSSESVSTPAEQSPVLNAITQPLVNVTASPAPRVFLATAMVDVVGLNGNRISCRAILDCGAQRNIMSINLQRQLKLPRRQTNFSILGVGGVPTAISCVTEAVVHSKVSPDFYNLEFIVVPKITGDLPNWPASPHSLPIPAGISLADPEWYVKKPVDLLLGSEIYWDIERDGAIHLGQGLPKLKPSTLGYLIVGKLDPPNSLCNLVTVENPGVNLDGAMSRFCDVKDIPDVEPMTDEHHAEENHLVSTYNSTILDSSRRTAVRQILTLEQHFAKTFVMKNLGTINLYKSWAEVQGLQPHLMGVSSRGGFELSMWTPNPPTKSTLVVAKPRVVSIMTAPTYFAPADVPSKEGIPALPSKLPYVVQTSRNTRDHHAKCAGHLSTSGLRGALRNHVYLDQFHAMCEFLHCLHREKPFSGLWNCLKSFTPFLEGKGAIHVGDSIHKSHEPWSSMHQLLLVTTKLQEMIVHHEHWLPLHATPSLMLPCYWPISIRNLISLRQWTRGKSDLNQIVVTLDVPSSKWILDKIEDVQFDHDKLVCVTHVRTSKEGYTRPITDEALLPVDQILLASVPAAHPGENVGAATGAA